MKDYWLAKLISSVGEVDSRKRLQKSIYLLQQIKGCPLQCDYILHYYGPYSFELAGLIDQLKGVGIIDENVESIGHGNRYKSSITDRGKRVLEHFEKTKEGIETLKALKKFIPLFEKLNGQPLWPLELAATVAYFYENNWAIAQKQTVKFKKIKPNDANLEKAVALAKKFKKPA